LDFDLGLDSGFGFGSGFGSSDLAKVLIAAAVSSGASICGECPDPWSSFVVTPGIAA